MSLSLELSRENWHLRNKVEELEKLRDGLMSQLDAAISRAETAEADLFDAQCNACECHGDCL
jgi:hypothetical protein